MHLTAKEKVLNDPQIDFDRPEIRKAYGISKILIWFIPIGFALMLASLLEGSITWSAYVCMTGWWGIVMGLNGAASLKRQFFDPDSGEAKASWIEKQGWALFTFWLPTLAAVALGGLIYAHLDPDHRPKGFLGQPFILIESLAMYLLGAGFAWTGVYGAGRSRSTSDSSPN